MNKSKPNSITQHISAFRLSPLNNISLLSASKTIWFFLLALEWGYHECWRKVESSAFNFHSFCIWTLKQIKFPKNIICNGKDGDKAKHLWRYMLLKDRYWIKLVWGIGIGKEEGKVRHRASYVGSKEVITIKVTMERKWKVRRKVDTRSCSLSRRYIYTFHELFDWLGVYISRQYFCTYDSLNSRIFYILKLFTIVDFFSLV